MEDDNGYDITSFYDVQPGKKIPSEMPKKGPKQKYSIFDRVSFEKGREMLGGIIVEGMKSTGGTDIDWLIEHRGGFVILEVKEFHNEKITIKLGQILAYEKLHERLTDKGKCYLYFLGCGDDIDFDDLEAPIWYFEMSYWKNNAIPFNTEDKNYKMVKDRPLVYHIHKDYMNEITISKFRDILEKHWHEFEQ